MSKTHLIADETIGGVEREYVEVDRKADVGDYVVSGYGIGKVTSIGDVFTHVNFDGSHNGRDTWYNDTVRTLIPTDIVHIDDARYRTVERKAQVGENILVTDANETYEKYANGSVLIVEKTSEYGIYNSNVRSSNDEGNPEGYLSDSEYHVLVPVETELLTVDTTQASQEVIDLLANLASRLTTLEQQTARRVTELETEVKNLEGQLDDLVDRSQRKFTTIEEQLRGTQANVERQAEEHEGLAKLVEANTDDIITLDERTQPKAAEDLFVKALVELAKEASR